MVIAPNFYIPGSLAITLLTLGLLVPCFYGAAAITPYNKGLCYRFCKL